MSQTDLLGDPLPDPLPEGERFTELSQLVGHTVQAVFDNNYRLRGRGVEAVIVTQTKCWVPLSAEHDYESAFLRVVRYGAHTLHDFVRAKDLLDTGCITQAEFLELKKVEDEEAEIARQRLLNHHRQQLAALEAKAP